jgi:hypothetical protein
MGTRHFSKIFFSLLAEARVERLYGVFIVSVIMGIGTCIKRIIMRI